MKTRQQNVNKYRGFTLIEMLLVLVIISTLTVLGVGYLQQRTLAMRIDRTSLQMQQVLNAAMAYYVVNNKWPTTLDCLKATVASGCTVQYLPSNFLNSPFGQTYNFPDISTTSPSPLFSVYTRIVSSGATSTGATVSTANIIAGKLPLSYTTKNTPTGTPSLPPNDGTCVMSGTPPTTCYIVASVNIPGQNLNNATAVNYAGLYHNGACVPAPQCPVDQNGTTMTPQIIVVPVSVSGVANSSTPSNAYPINTFTAYARGGAAGVPVTVTATTGPPQCYTDSGTNTKCYSNTQGTGTVISTGKYWRVCLKVTTEFGDVNWGVDTAGAQPPAAPSSWGIYGTVLAFTRCSSPSENVGSAFTVYAP